MMTILKHEALKYILNSFYVQDEILSNQLKVNLIGGWQTNIESKKMGEYVFKYFTEAGYQVNRDKLFAALIEEQNIESTYQGKIIFRFVSIDSRSGKIITSNDHKNVIYTKELDYIEKITTSSDYYYITR